MALPSRPPKALKPMKARHADECEDLEQLPNIGPTIAADLRRIGVAHPRELVERDAFSLYRALCEASGRRQDPCVLDTFLAAADFMRGAEPRPWWTYTAQRKAQFGSV
ncbi:MAG: helix-hairpin-helix domain-containing protein [Burkholderiales bacterium]|nr:helix-hairpin-helix domain-containing protein [Burkholderiales bacterium]MDE2394536.1 helix-hairpin-helix domain-containing protein [Burkholderiales bacterium]MDE2455398.1 helix-hairpin-helix domain-containing protein [Burkholderiales bacterium]